MIKTLYPKFRLWSEKGSIYLYSDTHFADSDCKFMDSDWPEPDEQVSMLNKGISKNDTIIILGDVGDTSYIKKLKAGYKVLIMGNHDLGRTHYERNIRKYDYQFPSYQDAKIAMKEGVIDFFQYNDDKSDYHGYGWYDGYIDNGLFDEVYEGPLFISDKIVLSHEPICITAGITGNPIAFNIHGHDHSGEYYSDDYHLNVCSNIVGYNKVSLNEIIKTGLLSHINSIHREIIDRATAKKYENL